jgi:hypothetical protein
MNVRRYLLGVVAAVGLCAVSQTPVEAHLISLRTTLVPVIGSPSPIVLDQNSRARFALTAVNSGVVSLRLSNVKEGSGQRINAANNTLRLFLVLNGVPQTMDFPFAITNGRAVIRNERLGLVRPDLVEIVAVELRDQNDDIFGTLGVRILSDP